MDKISENSKNLIGKENYFILIDNKENRKFCTVSMK